MTGGLKACAPTLRFRSIAFHGDPLRDAPTEHSPAYASEELIRNSILCLTSPGS
jgi:hypothetical protein